MAAREQSLFQQLRERQYEGPWKGNTATLKHGLRYLKGAATEPRSTEKAVFVDLKTGEILAWSSLFQPEDDFDDPFIKAGITPVPESQARAEAILADTSGRYLPVPTDDQLEEHMPTMGEFAEAALADKTTRKIFAGTFDGKPSLFQRYKLNVLEWDLYRAWSCVRDAAHTRALADWLETWGILTPDQTSHSPKQAAEEAAAEADDAIMAVRTREGTRAKWAALLAFNSLYVILIGCTLLVGMAYVIWELIMIVVGD
jgi:hypothetical protein